MTRITFTRWICNSCQAETVTEPTAQPVGWVGYGFTEPDIPGGEKVVLGHLCLPCTERVSAALVHEDVEPC